MMSVPFFWLASYPRSGNTLLRTILFQCFGLRSASVYPEDVPEAVAQFTGHVEWQTNGRLDFGRQRLALVKTHTPPNDSRPAIYVIRDGRAATVSLWEYYGRRHPIRYYVSGETKFGTWSAHVGNWNPLNRPQTTLVRYEDLTGNLPKSLQTLSAALNVEPMSTELPPREELAGVEGRWVRPPSDWREHLKGDDLRLFDEVNGSAMRLYRYYD
jgi:hypothetical protein